MTNLFIRNIDADTVARIKHAAGVRGMTLAQYVTALSRLHAAARAHADGADDGLQAELVSLGLETVHE